MDLRLWRAARPRLARLLFPPNSRMAEWWTRRSMAAAVVIGFLKIRSHSPKVRLRGDEQRE